MTPISRLKITTVFFVVFLVFLAQAGVGKNSPFVSREKVDDLFLQDELLRLEIFNKPFGFVLKDVKGKTLIDCKGVEYTSAHREIVKTRIAWQFVKEADIEPWKAAYYVLGSKKDGNKLELSLSSKIGGAAEVEIEFELAGKALSAKTKAVGDAEVNRVAINLSRNSEDTYFGMGERMNSPEHSGAVVRNWAQEGGMGLWSLSKIAPNLSFNPFPHGQDTTYFPGPFFLNTKGYGFFLEDSRYSKWDFGSENPDLVRLVNWNNRFDFTVFYGPDPLEIIESFTAKTGRITRIPPPWVFAPWNVAIGGSEVVRQVAETVRREHIPTAAIWSEDWWWDETTSKLPRSKEWALNRKRYPDYERMISELHDHGFRYLSYFQPYVFTDSLLYQEGSEKKYFTANPDGSTAIIDVTFQKKAQLDVTNPDAVKWWSEKLFRRSVEWGVDGWMTDFGEYTPPDSISSDGRSGWEFHNLYPVEWARINREFFDSARPDGDYTFFVRAGYAGSQKYSPVMWTGDSNCNWEKYDGLPSTIPAVTSVGISGFPITATDIAGFMCLTSPKTDKELFIRWAQLGALLPVMRNHRGNSFCKNWKFDDDRETLEAYKKSAILHTALFPYIYTLVREAAAKGYPVVRHLALHYPQDPGSLKEHYEFLVGDRLLVAPVIVKGIRERLVYFPPGDWIDFYNGKKYSGPASTSVSAPLDTIPLFVKSGSILPTFDSQIDTLVPENGQSFKGWEHANSSIKITFYGSGSDEYELWDGAKISCFTADGSAPKCNIIGSGAGRKYNVEFK